MPGSIPSKILAPNITTIRDRLRKLKCFLSADEAPDPVKIRVDEALALLDIVNPTFAEFAPGWRKS